MEATVTQLPTPAPPPVKEVDRTLVKKLAQVMAEVEHVAKRGRNDFHKYDYATEADINAAVRKGMAARNLMLVPSVEKEEWVDLPKEGKLCTLTVLFRLMDGDSGEELQFTVLGQGSDKGDKATYKAMTGALKYALLKLFLIPTGDDPEHEDAPKTQGQAQDPKIRARLGKVWEVKKGQGLSGAAFTEWAQKLMKLEKAKPTTQWTAQDVELVENALAAELAQTPQSQAPAPSEPSNVASPPALAPSQPVAPAAAPAAADARRRARVKAVWEIKKSRGMDAAAFGAWTRQVLGTEKVKPTNQWSNEDLDKVEAELHREAAGGEPGSDG